MEPEGDINIPDPPPDEAHAEGKKILKAQRNSWREFVDAINSIAGLKHA